jgi:hypothetical protein
MRDLNYRAAKRAIPIQRMRHRRSVTVTVSFDTPNHCRARVASDALAALLSHPPSAV